MLTAQTEATLCEMQDGTTHTRKYLAEVAGKAEGLMTCRACGGPKESLGHILSSCTSHYFSLYKSRHDRVLYVLVRQILEALELPLPPQLMNPGGWAQGGVHGTTSKMVKVDVTNPTHEDIRENRPDLVIRLRETKAIYIVEVACAWDGLLPRESSRRQ